MAKKPTLTTTGGALATVGSSAATRPATSLMTEAVCAGSGDRLAVATPTATAAPATAVSPHSFSLETVMARNTPRDSS